MEKEGISVTMLGGSARSSGSKRSKTRSLGEIR
jgi:hypothetical protein